MHLYEDIKCFCHAELCEKLCLLFQIYNKNCANDLDIESMALKWGFV